MVQRIKEIFENLHVGEQLTLEAMLHKTYGVKVWIETNAGSYCPLDKKQLMGSHYTDWVFEVTHLHPTSTKTIHLKVIR